MSQPSTPRKRTKSSLSVVIPLTIRRIRQTQGLSQEALAHLANLDRSYISAVERGRRNISIASLDRIVDALAHGTDAFIHEVLNDLHAAP